MKHILRKFDVATDLYIIGEGGLMGMDTHLGTTDDYDTIDVLIGNEKSCSFDLNGFITIATVEELKEAAAKYNALGDEESDKWTHPEDWSGDMIRLRNFTGTISVDIINDDTGEGILETYNPDEYLFEQRPEEFDDANTTNTLYVEGDGKGKAMNFTFETNPYRPNGRAIQMKELSLEFISTIGLEYASDDEN